MASPRHRLPVLFSPLAKDLRQPMRILTRYILREVISHAAIGIAVFTFVLFTRDLGHILDLVVRNSAPLPSVLEIFFFTLPVAFTYTIPMGVLVGILIGLSRLAADSEITAMRASGIGVVDISAGRFHFCRDRLGAGHVQRRVSRAGIAGRAGQARGPAQDLAGVF